MIHYINVDRSSSKTSLEQEWGKPTDVQLGKDMYAKPLQISDVYGERKKITKRPCEPYVVTFADVKDINCAIHKPLKVKEEDSDELIVRSLLRGMVNKVVKSIAEENVEVCALSLINSSLLSEKYACEDVILDESTKKFYDENIALSQDDIVKLCIETVSQSNCKKWFTERKLRISASLKAHKIKTLTRKDEDSLVDSFLKPDDKLTLPALAYGNKHEKEAVSEYAKNHNVQVESIGLFINPSQPWLCASPDAVVIENGIITKILEIKCPSSCATKPIYDENTNEYNIQYLYSWNNIPYLNESHIYYTQCQLTMYVTGVYECAFYVWSPKGSQLVTVHRDEIFLKELIPKLNKFYFKKLLPKVVALNKENCAQDA